MEKKKKKRARKMVKKTVTLKLKYRSSGTGKLKEFKYMIPVKKLYFCKMSL